MDWISLNTLLFAGKWLLIGLIYLALFVVLIAVRREMFLRVGKKELPVVSALGRLKVVQPGSDVRLHAGSLLNLDSETALGAAPDNDLVLGDRFISGHHARLHWDGSSWWLEDLGSTNGSMVNHNLCLPHTPQPVPTGGLIQVGDMSFELQDLSS